jgi:branched-chain amino acid aminotransferase
LKYGIIQAKDIGLMDTYYIDGQFVDEERALINAKDLIVLRGFGVFDFLITYNRHPFFLKEHVQRLENSARGIGLEIRHTNSEICSIVEDTVKRNPRHAESGIRIVYSGGISSDGVTPEGNGILVVMVTPKHELPLSWYTEGAKIITVDIERFIPTSKSTCYLTAVYAQQQAKKEGAIEAVYVDRNNRILEGTATNFFCFKNSRLVTPDRGILPGITRSVILDLVKGFLEVETRDIDRSELQDMEEVFITASNKEVVPIVRVNDLQIGDGRIGEKTRKIMDLFRAYTDAYGRGEVRQEDAKTFGRR